MKNLVSNPIYNRIRYFFYCLFINTILQRAEIHSNQKGEIIKKETDCENQSLLVC